MSRRLGLWLGGAAVAAGALALGPGAPLLVQSLAEGRTIWRLGQLEMADVSGLWIGDLRFGEVRLRDQAGVWLQAQDVRLRWSPQALLVGRLDIVTARVAVAELARQPILGPPPPSRGLRLSVEAPALEIAAMRLNEAVAGVAAEGRIEGAIRTRSGALQALTLNAIRIDAATDSLSIAFAPGDADGWRAQADGAPGGVMAGLLGAPEGEGVALRALAEGTLARGSGSAALAVGPVLAATARGGWSDEGWRAEGVLDTAALPSWGMAQRLGGRAAFEATGQGRALSFARMEAPNLSAVLEGEPANGAQIRIRSNAPAILAGAQDLPAAAVAAQGALSRNGDAWTFEGEWSAAGVRIGGFAGSMAGPVTLRIDRRRLQASGDLAFSGAGGVVGGLRPEIGAFDVRYDRQDGTVNLREGLISGAGFSASAQGDGDALQGRAEIEDVSLVVEALSGEVAAQWRLIRTGSIWRLQAEGQANGLGAPEPLAQLLGASPRWSVDGALQSDGMRIQRAQVAGPQARLGASGLIGTRTIDLAWEATARGPFSMGAATISGAIDATGRITGASAAPRIVGSAQIASLDLAGAMFTQATTRFAYADGGAAVSLSGLYGVRPVSAMAEVTVAADGVSLDGVTGSLAGLSVSGRLRVAEAGLDGVFDVRGPLAGLTGAPGQSVATVSLSGPAANPIVSAHGEIFGATLGMAAIERGRWSLQGPLDTAQVAFAADGRMGQAPIQATGEGSIRLDRQSLSLALTAEGTLARERFSTAEPIEIRFNGNGLSAEGQVLVAGGAVRASYRETGETFSAEAEVRNLPVAALSALTGESGEGVLTGLARLRSVRGRLEGEAQGQAQGFRLRGRMRDPIDGEITASLGDEVLAARFEATSGAGLSAFAAIDMPVETRTDTVRIAQRSGALGTLRWRAEGPADALWALTGVQDQALRGQVSGEGQARFGPGVLQGSGALTLRQGAFEDRLSGARLRDVTLDVRFADETVTVEALSARDSQDGRLTGQGTLTGARAGRLSLNLAGLRFVEREDITASADGDLELAWGPDGASLSGALVIQEATIRGAPEAEADIPILDVIEINRPTIDQSITPLRQRARPARLDLRITAPGRVFTRYRGFSSEWRLSLRAQGTSAAPLLFGEAELVRGEAQLAGRPLEVRRGLIRFRGPPEEATLDLVAEQTTQAMTARLLLAGSVGAPEVRFENDAGLPEDEVLPQLLFGASQQELSALQAAQLAASLSALAGGSAFDLADMTRRLVGLDRLDVRQESNGLVLAGGRYLTRDVYVELGRNGLGEAQSRFEWRLTPSLRLVTSFAQNGEQRASLRWRTEEVDE